VATGFGARISRFARNQPGFERIRGIDIDRSGGDARNAGTGVKLYGRVWISRTPRGNAGICRNNTCPKKIEGGDYDDVTWRGGFANAVGRWVSSAA
jgi:hypothetical protein